jgi:hypothetical protein
VTGEVHRYQFNVSSARSADDIRLSTGFNSDGFINGSARVGFRVLKPHDTSLSEARGFFAFVGTSMTLADRVRIGLVGERDLVPSYREEVAYYATHGYAASVTYTLRDSLSFSGQFGQRFVDYREAQGAIVLTTDEMGVDRETRYESGILYQVRESFGIEFSATYTERESTSASRRFDGMRVGGGIRYGF